SRTGRFRAAPHARQARRASHYRKRLTLMQPSGGPGPNETRNVILAIGLSLAIFLGFEFFYNGPARERELAAQRAQIEAQVSGEDAAARGATIGSAEAPSTREPANR